MRIISAIKELLGRNWNISIEHLPRESNHCADWIAMHFFTFDLGLHIPLEVPHQLSAHLTADALNVSFPRAN